MTDSTGTTPRSTQERKKVTGKLDRGQLEHVLAKALDAGPDLLVHQIRYILALSQLNDAKPTTASYPETPVAVAGARLGALVKLADGLTEEQRQKLYQDLQQTDDDDIRLQLLLDLLPKLTVEAFEGAAAIWEQADSLSNPLVRSEVLLALAKLVKHFEASDKPSPREAATASPIELAASIGDANGRIRSLVSLALQLPQEGKVTLLNRTMKDVMAANNDSLRANLVHSLAGRLLPEIEDRVLQVAEAISDPVERARALTALARTVSPQFQADTREKTLVAIDAIEQEDERANALVAFAPHLEPASQKDGQFPALLEKALATAISLTRRNLRARALVALAPHLTLDLQGEALAAVHSLPIERERALLLADLAPTLPPNMLVASLAVAHTMREQDARVHALTVLAHYAPQQARSQTLLDALAAATNLPHHYERVTALLGLVDILPPHLLDQALTNALETTRHIQNENARARALSLLGQHLPPNLLERALETATQITDHQQRFLALIGIIPHLSAERRDRVLQEMLDTTRALPIGYKRARALAALAPQLTPELIQDALKIADSLDDACDQVNAYIALAQNLPPASRPQVIAKTWNLITKIEEGYDRSSALAAIAPFLAPEKRDDLAKMSDEVVRGIEDNYDRASAISILAPFLVHNQSIPPAAPPDYPSVVHQGVLAALEIPQQSLRVRQMAAGSALWATLETKARYNLWCAVAQRMIALPLADVLLCLGVLTPVLSTFGGENQLKEIANILGMR